MSNHISHIDTHTARVLGLAKLFLLAHGRSGRPRAPAAAAPGPAYKPLAPIGALGRRAPGLAGYIGAERRAVSFQF